MSNEYARAWTGADQEQARSEPGADQSGPEQAGVNTTKETPHTKTALSHFFQPDMPVARASSRK